jgi:hypothetical protein
MHGRSIIGEKPTLLPYYGWLVVPTERSDTVRCRLVAGGSRIRTSGPSNQSSSAVLTPDAMAGHIPSCLFFDARLA